MQIFFQLVQTAGGRVQAIAGVQEGLYSVFAGYDRDLFDIYHLFFVDGTYHTKELNLGEAYHRVRNQVENSCSPKMLSGNISGENFWNCYFKDGEITGYTLATDQNGNSFKKQAVEYMKATLGEQGIQLLLEQANEDKNWSITEDGDLYLEEGQKAQNNYEIEKNENEGSDHKNGTEIPQDFVNPLEIIKEIRKKGILSLVLPLSSELSQVFVIKDELPSVREIEMGIGIEEEVSNNILDNLLFQEYIMAHLNCYTDGIEDTGLKYELEYVLAGKTSDIENLKAVVKQLLGVREAANMVYLMQDPIRQAELHQMSLVICTAVGLPALESVVSMALAAAWSFGESILDVRQLLSGGKVPFFKTKDTWNLSLEGLSELPNILKENSNIKQTGMSYKQYLKTLLNIQKVDQQVNRTIDIVENTIRTSKGRENFRMDCCFSYMEVNVYVNCNGQDYEILRDYGYEV